MIILGYIYIRTNKTLILNSLHVFDNWEKFNRKKIHN